MSKKLCPICKCEAQFLSEESFDGEKINCPKCGSFSISGSYLADIENHNPLQNEERNKLSSWISEQNIVFGVTRVSIKPLIKYINLCYNTT